MTLAGEYVLGLLDPATRREVERLIPVDHELADEITAWGERLAPLADAIPAIEPPETVWAGIATRLARASVPLPAVLALSRRLRFWRVAAVLSSLMAVVSLGALVALLVLRLLPQPARDLPVTPAPAEEPQMLLAALAAEGQAPALLARYRADLGVLTLRLAAAAPGPDQVPELWLIPGDGVPRSLGVLAGSEANLSLSPSIQPLATAGAALAISLEPPGGSPTGAPTGPVIASGALVDL